MSFLKKKLKNCLPEWVVTYYEKLRYPTRFDPSGKSVEEVFTQIYTKGLWGKNVKGKYYSGPGSDNEVTSPYITAVRAFIEKNKAQSVLDLGCGDFRVGAQLVNPNVYYTGIDVVKSLIDFNNQHYSNQTTRFIHANILKDTLPPADICIIRQVLQHLSNEQIQIILRRTRQYRFLVITEQIPKNAECYPPNVDIHHGQYTRLDAGSYVQLAHPPFNQTIASTLLEAPDKDGAVLQTVVIEHKPDHIPMQLDLQDSEIDVSIILCTYNRAEMLAKTLQSLCELIIPSGLKWELLVIDNNSSDTTKELCTEFSQCLPLRYKFQPKQGKSHALNLGTAHARGDLLVFTDDDLVVDPHFITALVEAAQRHPGATFFGGKVLPKWVTPPPVWAIQYINQLHVNVNVDHGDHECSITDLMQPGGMPFFVGANLAIRRKIFTQGAKFRADIGPTGLDSTTDGNLRGEEIELEERLLAEGHKGIYVPTSVVYHIHPPHRQTEKYLRLYYKGAGIASVRLNPTIGTRRFWFGVPRRLVKDLILSFLRYMVTRWICTAWTWLKAERDMAFAWGQISEYRRIFRKKSK